ncbi:MAG TPA: Uma2 family endonuclease [Tepidisphaeraceae bacterium]
MRHAVYTSEALFPLTVDQYHDLIRAGTLSEADPVELLEGILLYKMPKNPPHAAITTAIRDAIALLLPPQYHARSEQPVTLPDGEPEPDAAVVRGRAKDYMSRHPGPDEVPLIIEVADSSLDRDRGIKLRSYARAGIREYWIVNLIENQVEVYTDPDPVASGGPTYRGKAVYVQGNSVPLVIGGNRLGDMPVSAMLS